MSLESLPLPRSIPRAEDIGQARELIRSAQTRIHALEAQIAAFEIAAIFAAHPELQQLSFEWGDPGPLALLNDEAEAYEAYLDEGLDYEESADGFLQPARESAISLFHSLGPLLQERLQEILFQRPPEGASFSDHFMRALLGDSAFPLWQADAIAACAPSAAPAPAPALLL